MLIQIAIVLFVVGLILMIGVPLFLKFGKKEPELERKWTDPSFRKK